MGMQQLQLQVLTLNCWGLLGVSRRRMQRMQALAQYLSSPAAATLDIVCLQEVWVASDAELLITAGKASGLVHGVHFQSGTFGAGLVTLSRFPVRHASLVQYAAAGDPLAITCGDYYAAKGFGWAQVDTPAGPLDVFNTHLHANYSHKVKSHAMQPTMSTRGPEALMEHAEVTVQVPLDNFAPYRISQVWQLTQAVRHVTKAGSIGVILAGDLNCKPDSLEMALLRMRLPFLTDAWLAKPQHRSGASKSGKRGTSPAAAEAAGATSGGQGTGGGTGSGDDSGTGVDEEDPGFTCRHPDCTYASTRQVPERIDYVLTSLGVTKCVVTLRKGPDGLSYSDHFAVQAGLVLHHSTPGAQTGSNPTGGSSSMTSVLSGHGLTGREVQGAASVASLGGAPPPGDVCDQALEILAKGEQRCKQDRAQAYRAALLCLANCFACFATLLTPTFNGIFLTARSGPSLPGDSWAGGAGKGAGAGAGGPSGEAAVAAKALGLIGNMLVAVLAMGFSALGTALALKGLMADQAQENALRMASVGMRAVAMRYAGCAGTESGARPAAGAKGKDAEKRQLVARLQASARIAAMAAAQRVKRGNGAGSGGEASGAAGGTVPPHTASDAPAPATDRLREGAGAGAEGGGELDAANVVTEAAAKVGNLTKAAAVATIAAGEKMGSAVTSALEQAFKVGAKAGQGTGAGGGPEVVGEDQQPDKSSKADKGKGVEK